MTVHWYEVLGLLGVLGGVLYAWLTKSRLRKADNALVRLNAKVAEQAADQEALLAVIATTEAEIAASAARERETLEALREKESALVVVNADTSPAVAAMEGGLDDTVAAWNKLAGGDDE